MKVGEVFYGKEYFVDVEIEQFSDCFDHRQVYKKLDIMFKKKYGDNFMLPYSCYSNFIDKWETKYYCDEIEEISFYTLLNQYCIEKAEYSELLNFGKEPYGILSSITDSPLTKALLDLKIKCLGNYFETEKEAEAFRKRLLDKLASLNNENVFDSKRGKFVKSQKEMCELQGYVYEDVKENYYDLSQNEIAKLSYYTIRSINIFDHLLMHEIVYSYEQLTIRENRPLFMFVPVMLNEFYEVDGFDPHFVYYADDYVAYFASQEEAQKACEEIHAFFMENLYQMMDKDKLLKETYERYKEEGII